MDCSVLFGNRCGFDIGPVKIIREQMSRPIVQPCTRIDLTQENDAALAITEATPDSGLSGRLCRKNWRRLALVPFLRWVRPDQRRHLPCPPLLSIFAASLSKNTFPKRPTPKDPYPLWNHWFQGRFSSSAKSNWWARALRVRSPVRTNWLCRAKAVKRVKPKIRMSICTSIEVGS